MKKLLLAAAILLAFGICAISCSKDLDIDQTIIPKNANYLR